MKRYIIIFVIGVVGGLVAYWLISPLFIDQMVEERLSADTEAAIEAAIAEFRELQGDVADMQADMQRTTGKVTDVEMVKKLMEQVDKPAQMMPLAMMIADAEDAQVLEAMPQEPRVQILKTGVFTDVAHHGSGEAKLVDLDDGRRIIRLVELDVLNGPDLRVILSKSPTVERATDLGEYIELGKLKGNIGTQNYDIPEGVDLSLYHSVVIYCKPFHVVFNSASLN